MLKISPVWVNGIIVGYATVYLYLTSKFLIMKKIIGSSIAALTIMFSLGSCGGQQNAVTNSAEDSVNNSTMTVDTTMQNGNTVDSANTQMPMGTPDTSNGQ